MRCRTPARVASAAAGQDQDKTETMSSQHARALTAAAQAQAPEAPAPEAPAPSRVGAEVRALRKARNLTLSRLAAASGLSVGYLSMVEREKAMPSIKALMSIAHALGVTISWFFDADAVSPQERGLVVRR